MGGELIKEYVGMATRGCHILASRHPLLAFTILVLIWMYRSFPTLFALLVDASPVIASTTVLLGTLLFLGHSNAPEIHKEEKPYHHKIHNLKFGVVGDTESDWRGAKPGRREKASRKNSHVVHRVNVNDNHHTVETDDELGSSIDEKFEQEVKSVVWNQKEKTVLVDRSTQFPPLEAKDGAHRNDDYDDKGWETGSELLESTSPTASMTAGIIPMVDELLPIHHHPEVPQHADMSKHSTDSESCNSEEKEEDRKNLNENVIESAPSVSMAERSPSDISYNPIKPESESDTVDSSAPSKPDNQLSHHHESFDVGPSMHKEMDEDSDPNVSSTPDTESVGFPLNREADSTSIKEGFDAEVASSHYEDEPSRESDLIAVKEGNYGDDSTSIKKGNYTESVGSDDRYEEEPSREDDLVSVKEGYDEEDDSASIKSGYNYPESIASSRYEDYPSLEEADDSTSVKEGFDSQSVGSDHYEDDDPSREADLVSVKEGYYEEDDSTSVKDGYYGVRNSVKAGYCASEISDYVSQRSGSSDDDDANHDGKPDEVKTNGEGEKGYDQGRSISESPNSDVTDHIDDEEEDYHSVIMPLASHSKHQKMQEQRNETSPNVNSASTAEVVNSGVHDSEPNEKNYDNNQDDDQNPKLEHDANSTVSKPSEGRFPRRLSQVQRGVTSWFNWKA